MARTRENRSNERTFFKYPNLHADILGAVSGDVPQVWYCENGRRHAEKEYQTHVMGTFRCGNDACSTTGWGSKKVAIQIKGYSGNGYSARVYNQRCQKCDDLGFFKLDKQSYVDRVAYRVRKWAGIQMEEQFHMSRDGEPHRQDLCEGCRAGVCSWGNEVA